MARIIPSIVTLMVILPLPGNFLEDQLEESFEPNLVSLSTFLQRGILKKNNFALFDVHSLGAGEKFYMLTELGYLMPVWASVKLETQANVHSMFDSLKERNPGLYEKGGR